VEDVTALVVRRPDDGIAHLVLLKTDCARIRQKPHTTAIVLAHRQGRKAPSARRYLVVVHTFFDDCSVPLLAVGNGELPCVLIFEQRHGTPESLLVPLRRRVARHLRSTSTLSPPAPDRKDCERNGTQLVIVGEYQSSLIRSKQSRRTSDLISMSHDHDATHRREG
jgi:hypothetical protein